jgi:hypothetical protein
MKKEYRGPALETELRKILSGAKIFSLIGFANKYHE